jgi:hypothetical protein
MTFIGWVFLGILYLIIGVPMMYWAANINEDVEDFYLITIVVWPFVWIAVTLHRIMYWLVYEPHYTIRSMNYWLWRTWVRATWIQ